ncbi:hypothetical protein F4810DRAFT_669423 [Camillea tinctor]|nr:hypothetical protein F4810DRAFT_669423 [Camillea tinctor]
MIVFSLVLSSSFCFLFTERCIFIHVRKKKKEHRKEKSLLGHIVQLHQPVRVHQISLSSISVRPSYSSIYRSEKVPSGNEFRNFGYRSQAAVHYCVLIMMVTKAVCWSVRKGSRCYCCRRGFCLTGKRAGSL